MKKGKYALIVLADLFFALIFAFYWAGGFVDAGALSVFYWILMSLSLVAQIAFFLFDIKGNEKLSNILFIVFAGCVTAFALESLAHSIVLLAKANDDWYYYDDNNFLHAASIVMISLSGVQIAIGLVTLAMAFVKNDKEEVNASGIGDVELDQEVLEYVEYREGAIELHKDRLIVYNNLLPFFTSLKKGRIKNVFMLADLDAVTYKGHGWFTGVFGIRFLHFNRPIVIRFSRWLPWHNYKVNPQFERIFVYVQKEIIKNFENK